MPPPAAHERSALSHVRAAQARIGPATALRGEGGLSILSGSNCLRCRTWQIADSELCTVDCRLTAMNRPTPPTTPPSALAPLRHRLFRALWIASLASNVGTWMQNTAAAWLMTSLSPSPVMVALTQTATSLPFFLFALPA